MKDVSVGKKLLLGFSAVIAMIAVILALTVVTSLTRNNELQQVGPKPGPGQHRASLHRAADICFGE